MRLKLDRWAFNVYSNTLNISVGKATSFSFTFILIASLQVALNLIDLVYFTTDVRQKLNVRLLFFCKPLGVCFSFCLIIFRLKWSAKLIKTFCMLRKEKQREGKFTFLENCSLKSIFLKSSKVQIKYHKKYAKSLNITRDGVQFWSNSWAWLRKTNKQKLLLEDFRNINRNATSKSTLGRLPRLLNWHIDIKATARSPVDLLFVLKVNPATKKLS